MRVEDLARRALLLGGASVLRGEERRIEIWHGDAPRVGHLGDLQDDFNLLGHVEPWRDLDQLTYRINNQAPTPLAFRAYRRLVADGDFNADIPIARLNAGENSITILAVFRDGQRVTRALTVRRERTGAEVTAARWRRLKHFDEAGQAVDGRWELTAEGLRTRQTGYDRTFLMGRREWQDYEVRTAVTIHRVNATTDELSGGNGLGIILRFAGHVTGGPRHFPSGQPKWGYQPFGAIGWLRWTKGRVSEGPQAQFYPGDMDRWVNKAPFAVREGGVYGMRFGCTTLPDQGLDGVTRYQYKVWAEEDPEPERWTWEHVQTSRHALRRGGFALLAHHVDATFGDVEVRTAHAD